MLPAKGRAGRPPKCAYELGPAGTKWWRWAWRTPQATQWDAGAHYQLGRRAQLEDSLAALDQFDPGALEPYFEGLELGLDDPDRLRDALRALGDVIERLQALAGGRLAVLREMDQLDDRFGLNARSMAALGWHVESAGAPAQKPESDGGPAGDGVDQLRGRVVSLVKRA